MHAFLRRTVFSVRRDGIEADVVDQMAEGGETAEYICRLCEQDHCGSSHDHVHAHGDEHGHAHGHEHGHAHGHEHGHEDADGHVAGCDHDHGHCHGHDHGHSHAGGRFGIVGSILMSAVSPTVQVSLFMFLVTVALVLVLETVGEDALAAFLSGNQLLGVFASALVGLVPNCSASVVITQLYLEGVLGFAPLMAGLLTSAGVGYLGVFASALVGLVPNCSASVVITQLYLEGVLGFAPLMAGLLTSAGVGYLVLFRTNRHPRENVVIVVSPRPMRCCPCWWPSGSTRGCCSVCWG